MEDEREPAATATAEDGWIAGVVCGVCSEERTADRVPDFCGACGTISGRWVVVWAAHSDLMSVRMWAELHGQWPAWAIEQAEAELGACLVRRT